MRQRGNSPLTAMAAMAPRRGRPFSEVSLALISAVAAGGPAPAKQLAERACVGYDVARFKAKDLVRCGALVPLNEGRPRVLALPPARSAADTLAMLPRSFWESGAADDELAGEAAAGA